MHHFYATGRILYAIALGVFALLHFFNAPAMAGFVPGWVPGPAVLWVYVTGLILAFGSYALLTNKYVKPAALAVAGMLLVFILTIHIPAFRQDPMTLGNLLKDMALMGAALTFAAHHDGSETEPEEEV